MKPIVTTLFALATVAAAPLAASAEYPYQQGAAGIISSVNGGAVTLRNGRTIFLKDGTRSPRAARACKRVNASRSSVPTPATGT